MVLYTVKEVADLLRVHRHTVYRLIKRGQIPFIKVGGNYRINDMRLKILLHEPQKT